MSIAARVWLAIGLVFVQFWLIGLWLPLGAIAPMVLAIWVAIRLKNDHRASQRQERRRLLFDCDYQHAAWNAGDDRIAVFGRFQP